MMLNGVLEVLECDETTGDQRGESSSSKGESSSITMGEQRAAVLGDTPWVVVKNSFPESLSKWRPMLHLAMGGPIWHSYGGKC